MLQSQSNSPDPTPHSMLVEGTGPCVYTFSSVSNPCRSFVVDVPFHPSTESLPRSDCHGGEAPRQRVEEGQMAPVLIHE